MRTFFTDCFSGLWLTCGIEEGTIVSMSFGRGENTPNPGEEPSILWGGTKAQLSEYFAGKRRSFELPIKYAGTPFQKDVWAGLCAIPYGQTSTYGELARSIARPGAFRAVGQACHNNPIAIIIPCHRVLGSSGALTGFAGGIDVKRRLLELEGVEL